MNILYKLKQLDPSKKALSFLAERLQNDNYRGIQLSQHNRYEEKDIVFILEEIYKLVKLNKMQIRNTDLSKRPHNIIGEENYSTLVNNICSKMNRCTQDSLRKNLFVDMHRMGLIDRYNEKCEKVAPFQRATIKYISLTTLGYQLIKSKNIFDKHMIYTNALERLLGGFGEIILSIIFELDAYYIEIYELLFFATFVNKEMKHKIYLKSDIVAFIREYRALSKIQKKQLRDIVQEYCNPKNFDGNKTNKRDYHNWKNETQQIASLLSQTVYFEYNEKEEKLFIKTDKNGIYSGRRLKRSKEEKSNYFKEHKIEKTKGFELHHIVPLSMAKNRNEFDILDNWKNMAYIDGYSHSKITQNNNFHMKLSFKNTSAIFNDIRVNKKDTIICEKDKEISYNVENQNVMKEYNQKILNAKE